MLGVRTGWAATLLLALAPGVASAADAPLPPPVRPAPPPPPSAPSTEVPREAPAVVVEAERFVLPPDGTVSTATRTPVSGLSVPRATSTVTARDLFEEGARTTPQVLEREPGVFVQQTNLGGGSPILRGLTGEQVLLLLDGIRLNNATTRSGPTQYLNSIDPYLIDRVEVLLGPGSVLYGSDALGGVVNVVPKRRGALTAHLDLSGLLAARASTAYLGGTVAARTDGSWRGVGWVGGGNWHSFQDTRIDGGEVQGDTGYHGGGADLLLEAAPGVGQRLALAYQFFEDDDVPRTDAIESGRNLEFEFDPQRRQLLYLDWRGERRGALLESWRLNLNLQRWDEGRLEVRPNKPAVERRLHDRVDTIGGFGQAAFRFHPDHRTTVGFELYHDEVHSRRVDLDAGTGVKTRGLSRYPDGSRWTPMGVYLQDEWTPTACWLVVAGVRYSRYDLHTGARGDTNPVIEAADSTTDQLTGSLAASCEVARGVRAYASVAQGFRAPNVDDTTVFDRAASGIEVPNADLDPEQVVSYEVGVKADRGCLAAGLSLWRSDFEDLIQRVPGTWQGSPTIDGLPVSTRENVARATIQGFEAWAEARLGRGWSAFASASYAHGTDDDTDQPLNKIPPLNGVAGVRWTRGDGRLWAEPFVRWSAAQHRLSASDKADGRIGADGTASWCTANLRVGYDLAERLRWVVEAGNLFDAEAKHHGSGTWDPGRYLLVSVEAEF